MVSGGDRRGRNRRLQLPSQERADSREAANLAIAFGMIPGIDPGAAVTDTSFPAVESPHRRCTSFEKCYWCPMRQGLE